MNEPALEAIVDAVELREHLLVRSSGDEAPHLELPIPLADEATSVLATFLYANYYAFDPALARRGAIDFFTQLGLRASDRAFRDALSAANPGGGYFAPGWRIVARTDAGELLVEKAGVTLIASPTRHLAPAEQHARVGDLVSIRFPKDSALGAPGFYLAFADAGPAISPRLTRIYLNLRVEHAIGATRALLERLLPLGVPYTYKILSDPSRYRRRDSAVLYVVRDDLERVMRVVVSVHDDLPEAFLAPLPSFTRRVRDGVGMADNPSGPAGFEMSFGEHRTTHIAEAICGFVSKLSDRGSFSRAALRAAIEDHLYAAGLVPGALYLSSGGMTDHVDPAS